MENSKLTLYQYKLTFINCIIILFAIILLLLSYLLGNQIDEYLAINKPTFIISFVLTTISSLIGLIEIIMNVKYKLNEPKRFRLLLILILCSTIILLGLDITVLIITN